jgi:hypothetical protein
MKNLIKSIFRKLFKQGKAFIVYSSSPNTASWIVVEEKGKIRSANKREQERFFRNVQKDLSRAKVKLVSNEKGG